MKGKEKFYGESSPLSRRRAGTLDGMLNADWHKAHPMPKNPTVEQRIDWHEEHARECTCRAMPPAIREALRKRMRR